MNLTAMTDPELATAITVARVTLEHDRAHGTREQYLRSFARLEDLERQARADEVAADAEGASI